MKIAYLMPTYPMPSQTFIRREIAALEVQGVTIHRFAARRFADKLSDAADIAEQARTRFILDAGALALAGALIGVAIAHPRRWLAAFLTAVRVGRRSERGLVWHLIYLVEACLLTPMAGWLRSPARPRSLRYERGDYRTVMPATWRASLQCYDTWARGIRCTASIGPTRKDSSSRFHCRDQSIYA